MRKSFIESIDIGIDLAATMDYRDSLTSLDQEVAHVEFNNPQAVGAAWSRTIQKPSAIFINDGHRIRPGITSADPDAFVAELIALSARG